jgi:hypothetical protein
MDEHSLPPPLRTWALVQGGPLSNRRPPRTLNEGFRTGVEAALEVSLGRLAPKVIEIEAHQVRGRVLKATVGTAPE